ncbi:uncharacterized protein LOC124838407 [Vigna umbellata]|uniref:Uncharacterized protein n=2 Tax=Phaseolus angularis TaxID=3914 RepID=A0A0L9TJW9_PHAAN|nr:uncharacterized protein LOC108339130 [Vigna angularis]XP_047169952.1 uncharacterized protein LOC124838407 [Vigna umbellata]KAG2410262.1 uncharacterized protein HKW66_Vig0009270 [Vigna angularis]KOM30913.1 hypothetical protein LR48_Vigan01g046800 [Vigna angularis]BAT73618.1 hypothetical protein VIGAN_01112200 [Vigna angularis var. angularis]
MINCIRCCISCILPCGALDVIRIVHSNGRVEEITGTIKARDVMKAHPKHVLKKPCSAIPAADGGNATAVHKIVVVPPDAELQRGKIYFLMPLPPSPPPPPEKNQQRRRKKKEQRERSRNNTNVSVTMTSLLVSDRYLTDILSEKASTQRDRRRGRVAVWRPHLESISESPSDL